MDNVCLSVRLSVCDAVHCIAKRYPAAGVSEQVNGSASRFYNFQSATPILSPLTLPSLEPYMLVPSGEYIKT